MLHIVLLEPEKPLNTGNIGRSCLLTNSKLHLIRPFCFRMDDQSLRRAGLDYWKSVDLIIHDNYEAFKEYAQVSRIFYATTKAQQIYSDVQYQDGDYILFGKESCGIPNKILNENLGSCIRIPMIGSMERSLNLANSVNIILFEALRQLGFPGLK